MLLHAITNDCLNGEQKGVFLEVLTESRALELLDPNWSGSLLKKYLLVVCGLGRGNFGEVGWSACLDKLGRAIQSASE